MNIVKINFYPFAMYKSYLLINKMCNDCHSINAGYHCCNNNHYINLMSLYRYAFIVNLINNNIGEENVNINIFTDSEYYKEKIYNAYKEKILITDNIFEE